MNRSNGTAGYLTVDQILDAMGSYKLLRMTILYGITPVSLIGFVLNLVSLIVYIRIREANVAMYKYLRLHSLASMVICLFGMFTVFSGLVGFVPQYTQSRAVRTFYLYGFLFFSNICFLFITIIDLMICLERVAQFNRLQILRVFTRHPYRLSFISLVFVTVLMSIYFARYQITAMYIPIGPGRVFTAWLTSLNSFGRSKIGDAFVIITEIFRDVILLVLSIIANLASLYYVREFLIKKAVLKRGSTSRKESRTTTMNLKLSIMTSLLIFLSVLKHLFLAFSSLYQIITSDVTSFNYRAILAYQSFGVCFFSALNFFLYLAFNDIFRKKLCQIVTCSVEDRSRMPSLTLH